MFYSSQGLCFQGFVELFTTLAKLVFPCIGIEESLQSMIFYCVEMLKYDGIKDREFCVTSVNGPITHANKQVMIRLDQVGDLKRREAKSTSSFFNVNMMNMRKSEFTRTNSFNNNNMPRNEQQTKKSLFPIYF